MKFPQSFIDEVRAAADIVTVISDSVSLRKAGANYKGLCPFHGEKTPSFTVDSDKGFFHCFGCGVGGDVFKFVELQDKVGFSEAVRTARAAASAFRFRSWKRAASSARRAAEREALRQDSRSRARVFPRAARHAGRRAMARVPAERSRPHAGDDRRAADRVGAAGARCAAPAAAQSRLQPAAARDERPGDAARRWQRGGSVSQPADDSDRARHRHRDRLRRPRARGGSAAEVPELARDADLHEEPHALRPQPDQGRPSAKATSR